MLQIIIMGMTRLFGAATRVFNPRADMVRQDDHIRDSNPGFRNIKWGKSSGRGTPNREKKPYMVRLF